MNSLERRLQPMKGLYCPLIISMHLMLKLQAAIIVSLPKILAFPNFQQPFQHPVAMKGILF